MPELPEVETVKRSLARRLAGQAILDVVVYNPQVVARPGVVDFKRALAGAAFCSSARLGKYLLLRFDRERVLVTHLRMTGRLVWQPAAGGLPDRHTHVVWGLTGGGRLLFYDPRRFGRLWLVKEDELDQIEGLAALGPDALEPGLTAEYLAVRLRRSRRPLKCLLLDQTLVAGVGNIYADEILHRAGLNPCRPGNTMTTAQMEALLAAMRAVLAAAVEHGGTTIRDYVDGNGNSGQHQYFLQVYGRSGQACPRCGGTLTRVKLNGRGTCYCPECQV